MKRFRANGYIVIFGDYPGHMDFYWTKKQAYGFAGGYENPMILRVDVIERLRRRKGV